MQLFSELIFTAVEFLLLVLEILLVSRALLSIFSDPEGDGLIVKLCVILTEPLVSPVRALLNKSEAIADSGFDLSFIVTYSFIMLTNMLLSLIPH